MAKRVSHSAAARREYLEAVDWYSDRSDSAGVGFVRAVSASIDIILTFPQLYALIDGTHREAQVEGYPYAVVYRETSRGVRVVAVARTSREPGYWAERV